MEKPVEENIEKDDLFTIGRLAEASGVNRETIRFYERKSLISQPEKTGGFRYYSINEVKRVRFIKKAQSIGFTLDEVKSLLEIESCSHKTNKSLEKKTQAKIEEIKHKIDVLKKMLNSLETFSNSCGTKGSKSESCSLMDCFGNDWECC